MLSVFQRRIGAGRVDPYEQRTSTPRAQRRRATAQLLDRSNYSAVADALPAGAANAQSADAPAGSTSSAAAAARAPTPFNDGTPLPMSSDGFSTRILGESTLLAPGAAGADHKGTETWAPWMQTAIAGFGVIAESGSRMSIRGNRARRGQLHFFLGDRGVELLTSIAPEALKAKGRAIAIVRRPSAGRFSDLSTELILVTVVQDDSRLSSDEWCAPTRTAAPTPARRRLPPCRAGRRRRCPRPRPRCCARVQRWTGAPSTTWR